MAPRCSVGRTGKKKSPQPDYYPAEKKKFIAEDLAEGEKALREMEREDEARERSTAEVKESGKWHDMPNKLDVALTTPINTEKPENPMALGPKQPGQDTSSVETPLGRRRSSWTFSKILSWSWKTISGPGK